MERLTMQDIARVLTEKNGLSVQEANRFVAAMFKIVQSRLETDQIVKVKGLGTFKLITVEARESVSVRTGERVMIDSHTKITFTPDAVMRELVNKPFSQFETVVLNDGVEFSDLADDVTDEELSAESDNEPEVEPVVVPEPEPVVVPEPEPVVVPDPEPVAVPEPEPVVAPEPEPEPIVFSEPKPEPEPIVFTEPKPEPEPVVAPKPEPEPESEPVPVIGYEPEKDVREVHEEPQGQPRPHRLIDDGDGEEEESSSWLQYLMYLIGALLLLAIGGAGGYYMRGVLQPVAADSIVVHDTLVIIEEEDTLGAEMADAVEAAAPVTAAPVTAEVPAATQAPEPKPAPAPAPAPAAKPAAQPAPQPARLDEYEKKDERIRLGAYRIVGLEREVKVLAGQTFYSICRAHLGPDMECYVEAYNNLPRNPKVKEGQVIRIPKLQWKKRRK